MDAQTRRVLRHREIWTPIFTHSGRKHRRRSGHGVFGVFWTIIAAAITGGFSLFFHRAAIPGDGANWIAAPITIVAIIFPFFGVGFTIFAIWLGIHGAKKAADYQTALSDYESRRRTIIKANEEVPAKG